jgi:CHAD domain-containing protein
MSYRIFESKTVEKDVRRVAREQLDKAIDELSGGQVDRHEAVHDARKRLKKIRALLRLVRDELGKTYAVENALMRDTARQLSSVRDAEAMIEAFDGLVEQFGPQMDQRLIGTFRDALVRRRDEIAEDDVGLDERVEQVIAELRDAKCRVAEWRIGHDGFRAVRGGVARTYRRARKAMNAAYDELTAETFHEWRKRVKYHRYHTRLLRNVWEKPFKARRKALKSLSDYLGDEHDLAVFSRMLIDERERFGDPRNVEAVADLVDRRRGELRLAAQVLGQKLFWEKPGRLKRRWRGIQKANRAGRQQQALRPMVAVQESDG